MADLHEEINSNRSACTINNSGGDNMTMINYLIKIMHISKSISNQSYLTSHKIAVVP